MRLLVALMLSYLFSHNVFAAKNIIDILKKISVEDADWDNLDIPTRVFLEAQAIEYLNVQNKKYDAEAVKNNFSVLEKIIASRDFSNPAFQQLIKYYEANLKQFSNQEYLNLEPELKRSVLMLYLIRLADWRLIAANYNGFNFLPNDAKVMMHKDWDGVSNIDDMPMPDIRTRKSLKALAKKEISRLTKVQNSALKVELIRMLTQHETGSVNWSLGGHDLNTVYGVNLWTVDMLWVRRADFGNAYQDDETYIKALNSWFLANDLFDSWRYFHEGSLDHVRNYQSSLDATEVFPDIFSEQQADLVHSYRVLVNLYRTRLASHQDADKTCYAYSEQEITEKWLSFSADNKLSLTRTMQESYKEDFAPYSKNSSNIYKTAVLGAFSAFANLNTSLLEKEIKMIEKKIEKEHRIGMIPELILSELNSVDASGNLANEYQLIFDDMRIIGGEDGEFSDVEIQRLWQDVKAFIESESGLDKNILNDKIVLVKDERSAYTDNFGQIFLGLKKQRNVAEVVSILLHEAHHAIARKLNQEPSGLLMLEGAATFTQDFMMNKAFAAILPKYDSKTPAAFYALAALKNLPYQLALDEVTYTHGLDQDCRKSSKDSLKQVFEQKYGVILSDDPTSTEGHTLQAASAKANQGTLNLSYSIGAARYAGIFDKYQKEITNIDLNPYHLETCGVTFIEEPTAADIAIVRECVAKIEN